MVDLSWISCCVVRDEADTQWVQPLCSGRERDDGASCENESAFHDCCETENELRALHIAEAAEQHRQKELSVSRKEETWNCVHDCRDLPRGCTDLAAAAAVLERTREQWNKRVAQMTMGPELEWATIYTSKRMLRANIGDAQKAVEMFLQALEFRAKDRKLFQTMKCEPRSDMRIVGKDNQEHPVVYMCARSQTEPLRSIRDQFVLTFEAACKQTTEEGTVVFIVDAHGLRPHLNMDFAAMKDLADYLGTVYAERIFKIIIVDFSRAAQAAWWMLKPMLCENTRRKFAFVSERKARELIREDCDNATFERICQIFEINRDPNSTAEERALFARRTTLCDVPLGPPLPPH